MSLFNTILGAITGGNGIGKTVKDIAEVFDRVEDRKEMIKYAVDSKADARVNGDELLQRFYAVCILIGFFGLTGWFIHIYANSIEVPAKLHDFCLMLFGFLFATLKEVISFLFGSSISEMDISKKKRKLNNKE